MRRWDAIVVGAGPAGSTAARVLASQGARVLLLDRSRFPRYKACGGGIALRTEQLLPFPISPVVEASATKVQIRYAGRTLTTHSSGSPFARMAMRDRFDALLLEKAREAGSEYREAQVLSIDRPTGAPRVRLRDTIEEAEVVIGADGANSLVARTTELAKGIAECAAWELELRLPRRVWSAWSDTCVLGMGYRPWGYSWVFPKDGRLSLGVVLPNGVGGTLRSAATRLLDELAIPGATIECARGHKIRSRRGAEPIADERTLLVGDAAGMADEFTQEGIFYAIRSGELAARASVDALSGRTSLLTYQRRIDEEIMPELRAARLISYMFYGALRRAGRLWLESMARLPFLWNAFFAAQRGDSTYRAELDRAPELQRIAAARLARR